MRSRDEWRQTLSVMAAIAGTGIIPGRGVALFFGQFKSLKWLGIGVASAAFGLLVAAKVRCAQICGDYIPGRSAPALSKLIELLRGLFAALLMAMLFAHLGKLGALALPLRHAYVFSAGFALSAALLLGLCEGRSFPMLGLAAVAMASAFFICMALDGRPARVRFDGETVLKLAHSPSAAVLSALFFAAINGCAAGMIDFSGACGHPWGIGLKSGCMLLASLTLGCLALERGGDALLAQPAPWVVLSSRWGIAGFWLCVSVEYLCALASASTALRSMLNRFGSGRRRRGTGAFMLLITALLFGVLSF